MIKTTVKFTYTYTNTITYNIFFRFKIQSSFKSLSPVCIQIFIQLQFGSKFFLSQHFCHIGFFLLMTNIITKFSYLWDFDRVEDDINSLLHSYKESNKKFAITPSFFLIFKKYLKNSTENHQFWRCWHSFSLIQTKLCCCLKQHGLLLITGYNWLKS